MDFYLPDHNLISEIDGAYHDPERDRQRDEWFTRVRGIPILRLTNEQVLSADYRLFYDFVQRFPKTSVSGEA